METQKNDKASVSVVLSTFNNEKTIGTCLQSLKHQTMTAIETIIVDEFSTDKTASIASDFGAQVYQQRGERSICRNYGIQKSKGKYVLVLDSDMELEPGVIEECVQLCEKGAGAVVIQEVSQGEGFWAHVRALERSCYDNDDVVVAARFFDRGLIEEIGGYDPSIVGAEDWDVHQKIAAKGVHFQRTRTRIIHHEGRLSLSRLLRKKVYYGAAFNEFRRRYPEIFKKAFVRTSLLRNCHRFFKHPIHGIGVFFLKFCEGIALLWGMRIAASCKRANHY
jgi:glycosyltransferase involved in cell wall biosynthesis